MNFISLQTVIKKVEICMLTEHLYGFSFLGIKHTVTHSTVAHNTKQNWSSDVILLIKWNFILCNCTSM